MKNKRSIMTSENDPESQKWNSLNNVQKVCLFRYVFNWNSQHIKRKLSTMRIQTGFSHICNDKENFILIYCKNWPHLCSTLTLSSMSVSFDYVRFFFLNRISVHLSGKNHATTFYTQFQWFSLNVIFGFHSQFRNKE